MPAKNPLPANQPHVAIVLLWYPLFTQPFIFREVENLAKLAPIKVYTLYGPNKRHLSQEMQQSTVAVKSYGIRGLWEICREMGKYMCRHPVRFWRLLRRSLWNKWPNLEVFGENLWAFAAGFSLARCFEEDGIDFAYAPWPRGTATAAWVAATIAGIPFGIAARGDNLDPADPDLAAKFEASALIRANNKADAKRIEDFDKGQAKGKVSLIYNSLSLPVAGGAAPDRFQGKTLKLLALGRFDVTKGFDILLKACAILKDMGIPFTLTLAGGGGKVMGLGSLSKKLHDLRKALHLEAEVNMPGLISHDELPGILREHDIFLAPCIVHESGRRDGIPNTVIEALSYGMPVISTNVNALPEVVIANETGMAVPPQDAGALASAIRTMCENPQRACEMGKNGAAFARHLFDPEKNAARLAEMFQKVFRKCAE